MLTPWRETEHDPTNTAASMGWPASAHCFLPIGQLIPTRLGHMRDRTRGHCEVGFSQHVIHLRPSFIQDDHDFKYSIRRRHCTLNMIWIHFLIFSEERKVIINSLGKAMFFLQSGKLGLNIFSFTGWVTGQIKLWATTFSKAHGATLADWWGRKK